MSFKSGDIIKFVIKDPRERGWSFKYKQMVQIKKIRMSDPYNYCSSDCDGCQKTFRYCEVKLVERDVQMPTCMSGFKLATDQEKFLYYTHGSKCLVDEEDGEK